LYVCEEVFEDDDGAVKPYVPENMVLVSATALQGRMCYAGVAQVEPETKVMDVFEGLRIPQVYYDEEEESPKRSTRN
jgi:hypothetical protein